MEDKKKKEILFLTERARGTFSERMWEQFHTFRNTLFSLNWILHHGWYICIRISVPIAYVYQLLNKHQKVGPNL